MISVRVLFFARAKDLTGVPDIDIHLPTSPAREEDKVAPSTPSLTLSNNNSNHISNDNNSGIGFSTVDKGSSAQGFPTTDDLLEVLIGRFPKIVQLFSGAQRRGADPSASISKEASAAFHRGNRPEFVLALNQEFVDVPTVLQDGDEVALIPPVSGG